MMTRRNTLMVKRSQRTNPTAQVFRDKVFLHLYPKHELHFGGELEILKMW